MAISDKITSIQNHLKDDWDSVESLIGDTELDKNIENISSALDDLYNDLPKVTGSGTSITLDDTRKGRLESTLSGNTSQYTTTGKNLLDTTKTAQTYAGVTYKPNADGSITITGTSTAGGTVLIVNQTNPPILEAGTYTRSIKTVGSVVNNSNYVLLMGRNNDGANVLGDMVINENSTTTKTTTIADTNTMSKIGIYVSGAGAEFNCTLYIQLEKNNVATEWEPYTGGEPSPNPSYPQPINVVSGDNEINVVGKNLVSFANFTNMSGTSSFGVTRTFNGETIILNGTTTGAGNIIAKTSTGIILKAGTYTGSITTSGSYNRPSGDVAFYLRKKNTISGMFNKSLVLMPTDGQYSSTFTLTEDTEVFLEIYVNASNILFNNYTCKFQIEKGSSATTYEPYQGNTYNIDLPVENLFDISKITESTYLSYDGSTGSSSVTNMSDYMQILPSKPCTISYTYTTLMNTNPRGYCWYTENKTFISGDTYSPFVNDIPVTLTAPSNAKYIRFAYDKNCTNIQLQQSSKATPYGTTPIELCKIGNYQDYIYKDNGKWYLNKQIGKVVLNGSEDIRRAESINNTFRFAVGISSTNIIKVEDANTISVILSDKFVAGSRTLTYAGTQCICYGMESGTSYKDFIIYCEETKNMTDAGFKTWLSNNNVTVYYILLTPTNTEITDTTLINQLEQFYQAQSKNNQTNISQINNDLPFIISASALKKG